MLPFQGARDDPRDALDDPKDGQGALVVNALGVPVLLAKEQGL